jgi:hypothetical protein
MSSQQDRNNAHNDDCQQYGDEQFIHGRCFLICLTARNIKISLPPNLNLLRNSSVRVSFDGPVILYRAPPMNTRCFAM